MAKPSSPSPAKRAKTSTVKGTKNAFDVMAASARLCWPSSRYSAVSVLEIVAENGWLSWQDEEEARQDPTFSNLRLVSRGVKAFMDEPAHGGPDFEAIVSYLNVHKNGFDDDYLGFCDWCYSHEGQGCDTCAYPEEQDYTNCSCKKSHRFGPVLLQMDPRLNESVDFWNLPPREQAGLLLQLTRTVASNFHSDYYEKREGPWALEFRLPGQVVGVVPDLTTIDPDMIYGSNQFQSELREYNLPFYNFIHHLLKTGWADNDCYCQPGSCSPFRGRLIGDGHHYNAWGGGDNERFSDMIDCFVGLHKSDDAGTVPTGSFYHRYTVAQVQYLPETIRRCVANTVDQKAVSLLGTPLADNIDIYRLVRATYKWRKEELGEVKWMPCLGRSEDFVPLTDFSGYNPQHERGNIDSTGLDWEWEDTACGD